MYYFKVFMLFLIIGFLTWYSKNGSTLFKQSSKTIVILSYQNNILLFYKNTTSQSNHYAVIAPGPWTSCHPELQHISEWDYISSGSSLNSQCMPPPASWFVANLQSDTFVPHWPQPLQLPLVHYSYGIPISLKSLNTDQTIVHSMIDSISFLILSDSTAINDTVLQPFFETIDVLIVMTSSSELASTCRTLLRPRLCVTTAYPPKSETQANMIYLGDSCISLQLTVTASKIITPEINSCF